MVAKYALKKQYIKSNTHKPITSIQLVGSIRQKHKKEVIDNMTPITKI